MTVREHMKAAGYDPNNARNAKYLQRFPKIGSLECERVEIKTYICTPYSNKEMLAVEAIAYVQFTDGYEHPHYFGDVDASITAYFPIEK